jgi:glycosyltransferase involved in cell wall biosynthesis
LPIDDMHILPVEAVLPRVSVIIPCFNHGRYLEDSIGSVLRQCFRDIEIIIVDDGSTEPETLDILSLFKAKGFHVIHTPNQGIATARNVGIAACRSEYIFPLDADDRISEGFIREAVKVLDSDPSVAIVYCRVCFFGEAEGAWRQPDFSIGRLLIENMIVASSVFRRKDWLAVGGYSAVMKAGWEDWDFWLSLVGQSGRVIRLENEIFYYRIRRDSMTRSLPIGVKIRLFCRLIRNHKSLYFINLLRLISSIPAWLRDGRGRV